MAGCKKDSTETPSAQAAVGSTVGATVNGKTTSFVITASSGADIVGTISYGTTIINNVQGKMTTTGVDDYVYSNGDKSKPFKLVNYDDNVGTTWSYNIGNQKVVRTVTFKSTTDDTFVPALGLIIKIIEVTEVIPSGISVLGKPSNAKQIVWRFNHKFGFVGATVTLNNNEQTVVPLQTTNVKY